MKSLETEQSVGPKCPVHGLVGFSVLAGHPVNTVVLSTMLPQSSKCGNIRRNAFNNFQKGIRMTRDTAKFMVGLSALAFVIAFSNPAPGQLPVAPEPVNGIQFGESIIDDGLDFTIWDTETFRVHRDFNVLWDSSIPLLEDAAVSIQIDDPALGIGTLVYSIDTIDGEQSMLVELVVDGDGNVRFAMVPMTWDRALAWEVSAFGVGFSSPFRTFFCSNNMSTMQSGWGDFWSGYWYYLTHPAEMDDDLETGFYVSGGIGVGAGVLAGGIVAAPVIAGTTFTIPTIGITTTTTTGISGGGLVLGGTATTITTSTITVTGTQVVAGTAILGGTTVLMSVDPNKLHHIFDDAGHHLDDFLNGHGGNQGSAFEAVKNATQAVIDAAGQTSGLIDDIVVNVAGTNVTVRGVVIDGIVRIGTFFIP